MGQTAEERALYERFHERLTYDPETGDLTWRIDHGQRARAGKAAGHLNHRGYRKVVIDGKGHLEHRVAWLMVHGQWPHILDHKNGNGADNRLCNLREANNSQNGANCSMRSNNKAGYKGIYYSDRHKAYRAQITFQGDVRHLGYFKEAEQAHAAYVDAATRLHGEFARAA